MSDIFNPSAGGAGDVATDAIWDAKGDLAGGTGADTASRLAVGANNTVLTADSAEATGMKWATISGTGDVVGPASATDNAIARFDTTTGKLIQNSAVTIDDTTGNIAGPEAVSLRGTTSGTTAIVATAIAGTTTLTLPVATDTLVGKATTDTLTNKTFDADGTGNSITNIENADIKDAAAIALDKLATTTASRALVSDASGFVSAATTTATEIGYVNGVTSAIQTQINAKFTLPSLTAGSVLFSDGSTIVQDNTNFFFDSTANANFLRLGSGTAGGELRFLEGSAGGTNFVALKGAATIAANVTWTLPNADGTANQVLATNGSGVLSWATAGGSPGGSDTQFQYNNAGSFGGTTAVVYAGSSTHVTITAQEATDKPLIIKGAAAQSANLQEWQNSAGTVLTVVDENGYVGIGNTSPALYLQGPSADATPFTIGAGTPVQAAASVAGNALTLTASHATAGSSIAGAAVGGTINITAGNAAALTSGIANGGGITLVGGKPMDLNNSSSSTGGDINITAGSGTTATANRTNGGGNVNITGGNTNGNRGNVNITGGAQSSGNTGGNINLTSGKGTANIALLTSNATSNGYVTGAISLTTGTAIAGPNGNPSLSTGAISFTTGSIGIGSAASGTGANAGGITFTPGAGGTQSGNTVGTGGNGGAYTITGGVGGAATGAGGTHTGGIGSSFSFTSGAGGNATGGSGTRTGGNSGSITFDIGAVGTGATANGTVGNIILAPSRGNVGIGTSSPGAKLTVNGNLATTMQSTTLAAAATAIAVTSNVVKVTGDAGANTVATITGGISGQVLVLIFVDALVTITDTAATTADTVNLSAAFTSSADDTMTLVYDGNKWFETARSVN